MPSKIDLTGKKFHSLTVTREAGRLYGGSAWLCRCDCGEEVRVAGKNLRSGNTKSCGCHRMLHGDDHYSKNDDCNTTRSKKNSHFIRKYGITLQHYEQMLEAQNGVCAICEGVNPNGIALAVDHRHRDGMIRGLACSRCNLLLSHALDSTAILFRAIIYLLETDPKV